MMFTTKTEYGLRAMVSLAKKKNKKPVSLSQIAREEHISQPYLERLFAKLRADDLVISAKGTSGGYYLAREPKKISIFEVVEALDGPLAVFYCVSGDNNSFLCTSGKCLTQKIWHELQKNIIHTLRQFTLADLI